MQKETKYKLIIICFMAAVFLMAMGGLLYFGKIRFEWSDRILNSMRYEKNKALLSKILVIGDSQLEKWPLEHCLAKDIEAFCLENNIGCINAAHHGFGPIEYLDRAQTIAPDYKPDLILIFYYAGNDLTDVLYRSDMTPKKPSYNVFPAESNEGKTSRQRDQEVLERSKSTALVSEEERMRRINHQEFDWKRFEAFGIDTSIIRYAKNRLIYPNVIGKEYVNPWLLVNATYMPGYLTENTLINDTNSQYALFRTIKYLQNLLLFAQEQNAQICLVSIPNNVQVDTSHFDFYRKMKFRLSDNLQTSNQPQKYMEALAAHFGIMHLDLLEEFRKRNTAPSDLYFENDDHLSEKGHKIAFEWVLKKILIPYQNKQLKSMVTNPDEKYHLRFAPGAVGYMVRAILNNPDWLRKIQLDAAERKLPLDSVLVENALYSLQNEK